MEHSETEPMKERVVRLFRENKDLLANDIAEELGVSRQYVSRVLTSAGEDSMKRQKDITEQRYKVMEEDFLKYFEDGMTMREIREKLGIPQSTVYRIQKRLGVKFRDMLTLRKVRLVNDIVERQKEGKLNIEIAEEFGITNGYISQVLAWAREHEEDVKKYTEEDKKKEEELKKEEEAGEEPETQAEDKKQIDE